MDAAGSWTFSQGALRFSLLFQEYSQFYRGSGLSSPALDSSLGLSLRLSLRASLSTLETGLWLSPLPSLSEACLLGLYRPGVVVPAVS